MVSDGYPHRPTGANPVARHDLDTVAAQVAAIDTLRQLARRTIPPSFELSDTG
jgi:hypothetical protein